MPMALTVVTHSVTCVFLFQQIYDQSRDLKHIFHLSLSAIHVFVKKHMYVVTFVAKIFLNITLLKFT